MMRIVHAQHHCYTIIVKYIVIRFEIQPEKLMIQIISNTSFGGREGLPLCFLKEKIILLYFDLR